MVHCEGVVQGFHVVHSPGEAVVSGLLLGVVFGGVGGVSVLGLVLGWVVGGVTK